MRYIVLGLKNVYFFLIFLIYSSLVKAADQIGIDKVDDMLITGQNILKVAAKWGGILTVVGAALALGSGRLEGALAQTVCKVLIVIGLLTAAFTYFASRFTAGFAF